MHPDPSDPTLDPFVAAVVRQLAYPPATAVPDGVVAGDGDARAESVAGALRRLVADAAAAGDRVETAAAKLAADVTLLASLFQNVDLLYEHGYAQADAVSMLVMRAMEKLDGG